MNGSLDIQTGAAVAMASQAEAAAGTNNTKAMTPLRTAQVIGALSGRVRGSGSLRSYDVLPIPGGPATGYVDFRTFMAGASYTLQFRHTGYADFLLRISPTNDAGGGAWINSATTYDVELVASINTLSGWPAHILRLGTSNESDSLATFRGVDDGADQYLQITNTVTSADELDTSGRVYGVGAAGVGGVLQVEVIPAVAGKKIYPVHLAGTTTDGFSPLGEVAQIGYLEGGDFMPIASFPASTEVVTYPLAVDNGGLEAWMSGSPAGASLIARFAGDTAPPDQDRTVWAEAEQI